MESLLQDLRYAVRMLRKKPGFAAAILLTLTLGIGASTAIFSVLNATMLHPLPFGNADQLVRLYDVRHREDGQVSQVSFSPRNFHQVREQTEIFESVAAQIFLNLNLVINDTPERIVGIGVSEGWLATLGVEPVLGRGFSLEEERIGSDSRVALASHGFWERRLGSAPDVLGRTITLDNQAYTIIGVMPRGFDYPYHTEVWLPQTFDPNNGRSHPLNVQARIKPGATLDQAQTEMKTIAARLAQEFPETNAGYTIRAVPLREVLVEGRDKLVMFLLGTVGFLLLIACANMTNLLLARSITRQKEFAIRSALGARRFRQVRQFLTENLLLAVLGGAAGVLLTLWLRDFLMALIPPDLTYVMKEVPVDLRVLAFALLVSLIIGAAIAIVPAIKSSRFDLQTLLKEGGRSNDGASGQRTLSVLVVGEIALALALLTGAGLMIENLYKLERQDLGLATDRLLTLKIALTEPQYADAQERSRVVRQVIQQMETVPSVRGVAAGNLVPLTSGNVTASFVQEGRPVNPNEQLVVSHRIVSPSYFEALQIPIIRGRAFNEQDGINSQPVVIINQSMALRYWPGEDPVGKRVRLLRGAAQLPWMTVVGIAGDVKETSASREIKETWHIPFAQDTSSDRSWVTSSIQLAVRSDTEPTALLQSLKEAVWQVNRNLPVFDVATAESLYSEAISQTRVTTALVLCFAGFGFLIAILGTYGAFSYKVNQRTHEFGVRMALGASPADILKLVVMQAIKLSLAGVAFGLAGAVLLARFMSSLLPEIDSASPVVFAVVAIILSVVALAACYLPARRAMRVDPMVALRYE